MATAELPRHRFHFHALGGPCELQIAGGTEAAAAAAFAAAQAEVRRIEHTYSRYRSESLLQRINAQAGGDWVRIDAETDHLLDCCDLLWRQSEGLFDATSGVLRSVWDFKTPGAPAPTAGAVQDCLARVGWQHVQRRPGAVRLTQIGMELDFGGIGKEYAVDRVHHGWEALGVVNGLINLGGDLRVLGHRGDGQPWQLGIRHPRKPGQLIAEVPLRAGALATSGDYERFLIDAAGQRHCHLLNPRTGWPPQAWQSISVIAPTSVLAGGLSTVAMLKGSEALPWLDGLGVAFLAIDAEGRLHTPAAVASPAP